LRYDRWWHACKDGEESACNQTKSTISHLVSSQWGYRVDRFYLLLAYLIAGLTPFRVRADSASPELQSDALRLQDVSGADQDCRADQNRQCHHSSSFSESSLVRLIRVKN
jgi:hypothetical protein